MASFLCPNCQEKLDLQHHLIQRAGRRYPPGQGGLRCWGSPYFGRNPKRVHPAAWSSSGAGGGTEVAASPS